MTKTQDTTNAGMARRPGRLPLVAAIMLAIASFASGGALAAMYKWVDDKGVVHYTDQVPVDAVNKGNVQLNPQGVPIKKVDPAVTPEQRKSTEAERERQREAAKQQAEAARRDRALLDSYTTESDIDLAKSRAIKTLQAALESAQGYSTQLTKRKAGLAERKATYAGKAVPADIEREMTSIDVELGRQRDLIAQKNVQLAEVTAKYDADKERWQALKNGEAPMATAATPRPAAKK